MNAKPEIVQKVIDIHVQASEWILSHPAEALSIAVDWLGIDEPPVSTAFDRITYNHTVNVPGIEAYLRFLISEDLVTLEESQVTTYLDTFIDTSYLNAA